MILRSVPVEIVIFLLADMITLTWVTVKLYKQSFLSVCSPKAKIIKMSGTSLVTTVLLKGNLLIKLSLSSSQLNIEPNHTTLAGHCYEHDVVVASK